MPYINLQLLKGATREQKAKVVEEFTQTLVTHLNKPADQVHIVIEEIETEDWGYDGKLMSEHRAKAEKPAS